MRRLIPTLLLLAVAATALAAPDFVDPRFGDVESVFKREQCGSAGAWLAGRLPVAADDDWDVLHATLHFLPDFGTESLSGEVDFTCQVVEGPLSELRLDFRDNMSVDALTVDGAPAAFSHVGDQIVVTVAPPIPAPVTFHVAVEFSGEPQSSGFGSFAWDSHAGVDILATLSEPEGARDWWPCKDVPDEKFTLDVHYTVPTEFSAPGPGLLQSVTDHGDGTHTWHWREDYLINSYLVAMTVTNYDHYTDWYVDDEGDSLPIENYVYPENYANSVEDLSVTPEAFSVLDSVFSAYPFQDEKYGHAVFPWGGAMEHQTCTSYGAGLLTGGHWYDRIVVHELAHQWFGNAVTLVDWENVWLNEGFASYAEAIWFEHRGGQAGLTDWMTLTTADPVFDGPVYNNPVLFSGTVYRKGAWVLHMLRFLIDDDPLFYDALRYYYFEHLYGNAHTTDLQADLEQFLGLDLDVFFQQWVYGLYRPVYEWGWQTGGGPGAWTLELAVRQVQDNTGLFVMPLPFRVSTASGDVDLRVDNVGWAQGFSIPLGADEPLDVVFDPDNWVLENSSEVAYDATGSDESPPAPSALRGNWPNPFNPRTRIEYSLAAAGEVTLDVHDVRGRLLRRLVGGPRAAGHHVVTFDGLDRRGEPLPSGLYLARLRVGDEEFTHRMTLLK